ncbi:hypothetical protein DL769_001662 [Monosporascus sp. CRB-8-3]|nr:hypothetical protein DL769_001662 [Monosporascus sp. CRB-8-3]
MALADLEHQRQTRSVLKQLRKDGHSAFHHIEVLLCRYDNRLPDGFDKELYQAVASELRQQLCLSHETIRELVDHVKHHRTESPVEAAIFTVKYKLDKKEDIDRLHQLQWKGVEPLFQAAGEPWTEIAAMTRSEDVVTFGLKSREAERLVTENAADISVILNLSPLCKLLPGDFWVEVYGFNKSSMKQLFGNPEDHKEK